MSIRKLSGICCAAAILLFAAGCSERQVTNTSRSAVEQLLLSGAVERGTELMDFYSYSGKKAWLDYAYLAPQTDKCIVQGLAERRLAECGVTVVPEPAKADLIIQLLCPVLATDQQQLLLGTPKLPLPIPLWDSYSTMIIIPEIAFFKKMSRYGFAEFSINILNAADRTPVEVRKKIITRTSRKDWTLLLIPWCSTDIWTDESLPDLNNQHEILTL